MAAHPPSPRPNSLKQAFFDAISPGEQLLQLFDAFPGVAFFAKDRAFRLVAANRVFWERLGCRSESDLIGRDDFSLFPARLAETFRRDDEEVLATRQPKLKIIELFFNRQGLPDWFLTNKYPVFAADGTPVGIIGTVQSHADRGLAMACDPKLDGAVSWLRAHFREPVSIAALAKIAGLSVRSFNRRFHAVFGVSPQTFLIKTRIQAACEALRHSATPIGEIALDLGFYDQSSFTGHFRRHLGVTPLRYRQESQRMG
ncbi:MAG: AraC family transcriptional regulator [Verrucomicrobiales bacterium]|nr:AraC family transcriptional regulator [Verrucomicrobiales bacterium]